MTVYLSDTFTGSSGASLGANWVVGQSTSGASATIQGNAARLNVGTISAYGGKRSDKANVSNKVDAEILCDFKFPSAMGSDDVNIQFALRGDATADGATCYFIQVYRPSSTWKLYKSVAYAGTNLATSTFGSGDDTWYRIRFQVIGTSLKAKIWPASSSEPGSWGISVTDSSITGAGTAFIACLGGVAGNGYTDFDNFTLSDGSTLASLSDTETGHGADSSDAILASVSGADTGSTADAASNQARSASELSTGNELGSVDGTPLFASDVSTSVTGFSIAAEIAATEHALAMDAGTTSVPPTPVADFDFGFSHDFTRKLGTGPYRLILPWTEGQRADDRFFRRISVHRGMTLLRINGTYRLLLDPTIEELVSADRIYLGGYDNWVTDDEAQELGNAGWSDIIENFVYVPDSFYGSAQYGLSVYGD